MDRSLLTTLQQKAYAQPFTGTSGTAAFETLPGGERLGLSINK